MPTKLFLGVSLLLAVLGVFPGIFGQDVREKTSLDKDGNSTRIAREFTNGYKKERKGPTCNKPCPVLFEGGQCVYECDCPSRRCHYPEGSCACPLGFSGFNCSVPCPSGYYGPNCRLQCQCEVNVTCSPETGSCIRPQNISTLPDDLQVKVHIFRMATLTGCGIAAVVALVSASAYAIQKRRTRRVFNVRKRTMSMTPIANRTATDCEGRGRCSTASYVGMKDLHELADRQEANPVAPVRPISCLSTSTTFSMVESLSELGDTIYEVRESNVLDALKKQPPNPRYTNYSVFSVDATQRLDQRLSSIKDGFSIGGLSDSDDELEYNYPYADFSLRLPAAAEMTRDSRELRPCSSNTEYVVVLNQHKKVACYTPAEIEQGLQRERPTGISFSTETAPMTAPSVPKPLPSPEESLSTDSKTGHYQVPRSPPIQRFVDPSNQKFARGYVTSVKKSSSLKRSSDHRRTRRLKSAIVKCPPPPPYSPPKVDRLPPLYVNNRTNAGGARHKVSFKKKAPPIPKPRTRHAGGTNPVKSQEAEKTSMETTGTERFI